MSQKSVILEYLHTHNWVTLSELMNIKYRKRRIANITGRISDIRADGHKVINSVKHTKGGTESVYLLVPMTNEENPLHLQKDVL